MICVPSWFSNINEIIFMSLLKMILFQWFQITHKIVTTFFNGLQNTLLY